MNTILKSLSVTVVALMLTVPSFAQGGRLYGKKFDTKRTTQVAELSRRMEGKDKMEVVLTGEISQVCQAEGCWMKMKNEAGEDVFVKFKDHSFVIPKDLAGHKATVNGVAIKKTVSVEEQRHLAEDGGKTEEEIAAITQPKAELRVEATGVIID